MSGSLALAKGVDLRGPFRPGCEALVRKGIDAQTRKLRAGLGEDHEASRLDLAASLLKDFTTLSTKPPEGLAESRHS